MNNNNNRIHKHLTLLQESLIERVREVEELQSQLINSEHNEKIINIIDGSRRDLLFIRDSMNRVKATIEEEKEKISKKRRKKNEQSNANGKINEGSGGPLFAE